MKKVTLFATLSSAVLLLTACGSNSSSPSVNMNKQSPSFQNGAHAGCDTAKGMYTKDHEAFKNDMDYQNGWFYGRKKCNPADAKH